MAHIRKVDGRPRPWVVRYRTPQGAERSRSFARKTDAENFAVMIESSKLSGEFIDPRRSKIRLDEWAETWFGIVSPTLKPKTAASYRSLMRSRVLPTFGAWPLSRLQPSDVQRWIARMETDGLSPSRIRQAHVVLSSMLDAAVRDHHLARNPAHKPRLPRMERHEARFFEPSTVDAIIGTVPDDYRAFIAVQGVLGLRFGEAAALRTRSVNMLRRRLLVDESLAEVSGALIFGATKSHATPSVPIAPSVLELLKPHLMGTTDSLLFTSARGLPLRYSRFRPTVWVPTLDRLGLPRTGLHALRHSAAARMIGAGWSAKAVQQVLGHGSASFTLSVYGHLFDDDLDALGEALDSTSRGTSAVQSSR